jgi:hypothetical protein
MPLSSDSCESHVHPVSDEAAANIDHVFVEFKDLLRLAYLITGTHEGQENSNFNDGPVYQIMDKRITRLSGRSSCTTDGYSRVLVLGDSHAQIFLSGNTGQDFPFDNNANSSQINDFCGPANYYVCSVIGATAYGLLNSTSKTRASERFSRCIISAGKVDAVAIVLGDNDVNTLFDFRQKKMGITMLEQINVSVANMVTFVEAALVQQHGYSEKQIVFMGAAPRGFDSSKNLASARFNQELRDKCRLKGFSFASPWDDIVDHASGFSHNYFRSMPMDLHCTAKRAFYFWHQALTRELKWNWCKDK